jgi:hypothetical protein
VSTYELKVARLSQVVPLICNTCIVGQWNHAISNTDLFSNL